MGKYYLGLDMGTNSIGWAVTDENYNLIRKKGKDLWGVRLFPEAKTAQERRSKRCERRRRQREKARIGCLQEMFADAINEKDPGFYQRLEDSRFLIEDKREHQPFVLFADRDFTDKDYYAKYPTIYHLRKELLQSKEPHDVRLVYLAVLNMYKHRGHFLNTTLTGGDSTDEFESLYKSLVEKMGRVREEEGVDDFLCVDLKNVLTDKRFSKSRKVEVIREVLKIDKKDKIKTDMWKLICGLQVALANIFPEESMSDEFKKYKLSFDDSGCEEKMLEVEGMISEEAFDALLIMKQIHDCIILADIMAGGNKKYHFLSEARVASYEKHKKDLKLLKKIYKVYLPEKYDEMFRKTEKDNYCAYIGSSNVNGKVRRRNEHCKIEELYARIKKETGSIAANSDVAYILEEIEKGTFLLKQMTALNGVIPNQIHRAELEQILKNAAEYLPFLNETDKDGMTVSDKIIALFKFQIPYYIGPLIKTEKNNAWVVRKEDGKVYPWNLEQKIDVKMTAEEFIGRMVNHCTYLSGEKVLPKNSLLYERFMVLNELNNLKINGQKISAELKQELYKELFGNGKKVTGKRIKTYLFSHGYVSSDMPVEITGIDGDCINRLSNYKKFLEVFKTETLTYEQEKIAEDIILWGTLYGDSKHFWKEKIEEKYGEILTPEQKKRILGYRFRDWSRLSREFLCLEGESKQTGETASIISRLWNENYNLMQLLGDEFTYKNVIEERTNQINKVLSEIQYEDLMELYISAPVRRMTWQTILILKELQKVLGRYPDKIFVEMAREHRKESGRTVSKKRKFEELYKKCGEEAEQWLREIEVTDEYRFRSKKLYLYYTQKGRCMYTGERIELSELFNDNRYDIDHIYPRHFVKDDNIDNNLVLVKKEKNAHKSDSFPIESGIQKNQLTWWNLLLEGGFITKEKYNRLTRKEEFTIEEQTAFISRQIVETRQGTKTIVDVLKKSCPETDIVYVKAGNVSDFRNHFHVIKCRSINDFHHAHDAYLNVVVGNVYDVKFTRSPKNFVEAYRRDPVHNPYHMDKIFDFNVKRGSVTAWDTKKSIRTVRSVLDKNSPLVTYMNYEVHGELADQNPYSASKAAKVQGEGYIPLKTSDSRLANVQCYGGFTKYTGTYFFVVEHTVKKKTVRTLEAMPLYLKANMNKIDEIEKYCRNQLKYIEPQIVCSRIKMYSLMKIDGYYAYISGRTGNQILLVNAIQLVLKREYQDYIKKLDDIFEKGLDNSALEYQKTITKEKNQELYRELLYKHKDGIYGRKPNPVGEKLEKGKAVFKNLSIMEQATMLREILKLSQRLNEGANLALFGEGKKCGITKMNKEITGLKECKVIHQSVTGLYVTETDLLNI